MQHRKRRILMIGTIAGVTFTTCGAIIHWVRYKKPKTRKESLVTQANTGADANNGAPAHVPAPAPTPTNGGPAPTPQEPPAAASGRRTRRNGNGGATPPIPPDPAKVPPAPPVPQNPAPDQTPPTPPANPVPPATTATKVPVVAEKRSAGILIGLALIVIALGLIGAFHEGYIHVGKLQPTHELASKGILSTQPTTQPAANLAVSISGVAATQPTPGAGTADAAPIVQIVGGKSERFTPAEKDYLEALKEQLDENNRPVSQTVTVPFESDKGDALWVYFFLNGKRDWLSTTKPVVVDGTFEQERTTILRNDSINANLASSSIKKLEYALKDGRPISVSVETYKGMNALKLQSNITTVTLDDGRVLRLLNVDYITYASPKDMGFAKDSPDAKPMQDIPAPTMVPTQPTDPQPPVHVTPSVNPTGKPTEKTQEPSDTGPSTTPSVAPKGATDRSVVVQGRRLTPPPPPPGFVGKDGRFYTERRNLSAYEDAMRVYRQQLQEQNSNTNPGG